MPDIQPPKKGDNEEPLIPMPSVTPPAAPDAPVATPPKLTPDKPAAPTPAPTVQKSESAKTAQASNAESKSVQVETSEPETPANNDELDDIKQKALMELKPLLDEVDLPPEQMFHTLLEIVSVTNDKDLIPKLYQAAEGIEDKHEKAQALIDVVSEIEYLNKDNKS